MHTMWKGTISFGLVNIPVKLHAATENKDIKLRQLHKECHTPISYEKVCSRCEKEVANEDIVKAYEYEKNKFVVLDDEDLQSLRKESEDKAVEIIDFVKLEEIDPIYFDKSYFLAPDTGGGKAYVLLRQSLEESGKIGVAKIIIRSKEQLAIVRVYQNTLVMETIHFPDEVRNAGEVAIPDNQQITKKELDTALMLIKQLTTPFDPEKYQDDYRNALLDAIEQKRAGEKTVETTGKPAPAASNVTDLMSALQASIDKNKKKTGKQGTKKKPSSQAGVKKKAQ
ncbi:Ku protein [Salipaludibacillus agaradhaerens]|uniref:non-homologous end joining protein Ku n=1 Tax=Salipaludibacillus agaradhaerens TaxID=76935 RepID=UPI0021511396|nr:Ku protein [Salipaludibacillus agaradhaerens]MCR6108279.1 Ku protein [Salipaludibacillus agaradhaerens]MCR6120304.1 Ku protein [Salipaludibacillus agaradhaerens]UJW59322.1 Ku protein [Bacillus sp. A116_S68]